MENDFFDLIDIRYTYGKTFFAFSSFFSSPLSLYNNPVYNNKYYLVSASVKRIVCPKQIVLCRIYGEWARMQARIASSDEWNSRVTRA